MTRPRLFALMILVALLAGCASPAASDGPAKAGILLTDREPTTFGDVVTGPAAGPDLNATTAAPPVLVPGEWWRIRYTSNFFDDVPELVRVVAAVEPDGYVIGMPHEGWFKEAIALHAPAFGDVGLDLSYALHNVPFEPLRFPLEKGATWATRFGATDLVATVDAADEHTATIRLEPPARDPQPMDHVMELLSPVGDIGTMTLVYDARQHEVVKFDSFMGTWEVVEHGYDFEGWVTVPRGLHTAIDHGQFLPVTPGEPVLTRSQAIEGGFNRLTILQGVFALGPGAYRARAIAPDGAEYAIESVGAARGFLVKFHEVSDPDGTWTLEDLAGGPGGTYTMGMAYHQYDIRLPDGLRRADHSHEVVR